MTSTKTPEEMAEEYANTQNCLDDRTSRRYAFLAGYQAAKDQLADADKVMPQWISVKDRLPEERFGWIMVYGCILSRWSVQPGFYDRQRKEWLSLFINGYEYTRLESVTHWQPLPEAPKGEG